MSLRNTISESSWVTYVSPLVRIIDSSSEPNTNRNTPAGIASSRERSVQPSSAAEPEVPIIAEEYFSGFQTDGDVGIGGFSGVEGWDVGIDVAVAELPIGFFDSVSGMETGFWEQPGS